MAYQRPRLRESRSVEHYEARLKRLARFSFIGEQPTVPQPSMRDEVARLLASQPDQAKEVVNWIKEGF